MPLYHEREVLAEVYCLNQSLYPQRYLRIVRGVTNVKVSGE